MRKKTTSLLHRALAVLMAFMLSLGLVPATALAEPGGSGGGSGGGGEDTITVYVDFEGYNLGQGFYIEPTALELPAGSTAAEATVELFEQKEYEALYGGILTEADFADSFYLTAIKGSDSPLDIPSYITENGGPSTDANEGNPDEWLGAHDYSDMSGWMYTVDHAMANVGANNYKLQDGEVIRWQFTVWGTGSDLGLMSGWNEPYYIHADKTELIRTLFTDGASETAKRAALDVIINPLATTDEVEAALAALNEPVVPVDPNEPVIEPTAIYPGTTATLTLGQDVICPALMYPSQAFRIIHEITYTSSIPGLTTVSNNMDTMNTDDDFNAINHVITFAVSSTVRPGDYVLTSPVLKNTEYYRTNGKPQPYSVTYSAPLTGLAAYATIPIHISSNANPAALQAAVTSAIQLQEGSYTPESWAGFVAKLQVAQEQLKLASTRLQSDYDVALQELDAVRFALEPASVDPDVATTSDLVLLLEYVGKLNWAVYTPESWAAVEDGVSRAQSIMATETPAQAEITDAYSVLLNSLAALKSFDVYAVTVSVYNVTNPTLSFTQTTGYDENGFDIFGNSTIVPESVTVRSNNSAVTDYVFRLPAGAYSVRGTSQMTDPQGGTTAQMSVGGTSFTVPTSNVNEEARIDSITLQVVSVYAAWSTAEDLALAPDVDYSLSIKEVAGDQHRVMLGAIHKHNAGGRIGIRAAHAVLVQPDRSYSLTFTPIGSKDAFFMATEMTTTFSSRSSYDGTLDYYYMLTAPSEATVSVAEAGPGGFSYYTYFPIEPLEVRDNGDGTNTYFYEKGNLPVMWRASMPGKVTQAGWSLPPGGAVASFGPETENLGDTRTSGVMADYDGNSMLQNIRGGSQFLNLSGPGSTYRLYCFRMWEIIHSPIGNLSIAPDWHYRFLSGEDVVSLEQDDTSWYNYRYTMTALTEGTAIIEFSYDPIDCYGPPTGFMDNPTARYGATNPERKGIVVVTVGAAASGDVRVHLPWDAEGSSSYWDSEFDTWFMTGESEHIQIRPYTSASNIATVTAFNPDVPGSEQTVTDGDLTIWPGNNIVKVEFIDGTAYYKVIRGGSVRIEAVSDIGNRELEAGDVVRVVWGDGIPAYPLPKMSGIYNPGGYTNFKGWDDEITITQNMVDSADSVLRSGGSLQGSDGLRYGRLGLSAIGSGAGAHREVGDNIESPNAGGGNAGSISTYACVIPTVYLSDWRFDALDTTALEAVITEAEALVEADYTADSWAVLAEALSAAQTIVTDDEAIQSSVDAAAATLSAAISALETAPFYTLVSDTAAITQGSTLTLTLTGEIVYPRANTTVLSYNNIVLNYQSTIPGLATVSTSVTEGTSPVFTFKIPSSATPGVYRLQGLTFDHTEVVLMGNRPQGINYTKEPLPTAPQEIIVTVYGYSDPTALVELVAQTSALSASDYTFMSWSALRAKRIEAQTALDNPASTQIEIDAARNNLRVAYENLQLLSSSTVDRESLSALIAAALALSEDDYALDGAWGAMAEKLATAQSVYANGVATTEQVEAAYLELTSALLALKDKATWVVTVTVGNSDTAELEFFKTTGFNEDGYDIAGDAIAATRTAGGGKTSYSLTVRDGTYSVRGTAELYMTDGSGERVATDIGGAYFSIPSANSVDTNKIDSIGLTISSVYSSQSLGGEPLVAGDDYTIAVKDRSGRSVRLGGIHNTSSGATARTAYAASLITDASYNMTITPAEKISEYFSGTVASKGSSASTTLEMGSIYSLTAPAEATVLTYSQAKYYVNVPGNSQRVRENDDGTKTYYYTNISNFIWRVSMPGKVTKAGWGLSQLGTVVTFDDSEDPGDTTTTMQPDRDGNSLLMNIPGGDNHLPMSLGGTFQLRCFRMWEIINSDWQNKMIEPDFHFKLLEGEDILTLTPHDGINSNWVDIKATGTGTAIIEVSYDAIDVFGAGEYTPSEGRFGASNPERKGIIVVTVGGNTSTNASIQVQRPGAATYGTWDSEFDTWFFTGKSTEIDIRLSGSGDAGITAWNPDVNGSLHTVTDGKLTIYPGNNIVKAERNGLVYYKVIRGGSVRVVTDVTGRDLQVGDTVRVLYGGHIPAYPVPKMSGIYNPQNYGKMAAYDDEIVLTEEHLEGIKPLRTGGSIEDSHLGSGAGTHRTANYDDGLEINMNAGASAGTYSVLPDVYLADLVLVADKDALETAIAEAEALIEADYTVSSWASLATALAAAQTVMADDDATQQEVDDAATALALAIEALMPIAGEPVDVTITFQQDASGFWLAKQETEVEADLSERYGYIDEYRGAEATALDALVAAHIALFTDEELDEWLAVSESGSVTTVLGEQTSNFMYFVNGAIPHDGVLVNWPYFGLQYTGYTVSQALLSNDDDVSFVLLQDSSAMDYYTWFEVEGQKASDLTVSADEPVELTLQGYMAMYYGLSEAGTQAEYTEPIADAAIVAVEIDDSAGFKVGYFGEDALTVTDDDGVATLSFDEPGTYILSAIDDADWIPLISPWLTVTVTRAPADKTALETAITEAEALTEAGWTSASWAALQTALAAAKTIAADDAATQLAVDDAAAGIRKAIDDLKVAEPIKVIVDFEGYNLGQGFYLEPIEVVLTEGATVKDAVEKALGESGYEATITLSGYLEKVSFDTRSMTVDIPAYVTSNPGAPSNASASAAGNSDAWLGQGDYTSGSTSTWAYTVNHQAPGNNNIGRDGLDDGDVIRVQFSMYGYGLDLGVAGINGSYPPFYTHVDKTELIRALFADTATQAAQNAALDVIINPLATADEVAAALDALTTTTPPEPAVPELLDLKVAQDAAGSSPYAMTPQFDSETNTYTVVVPDALTSFYLYATAEAPNTLKVRYPGPFVGTWSITTVPSGEWRSIALGLARGSYISDCTIYVGEGSTSTMYTTDTAYTINVIRSLSLSNLVVDGALSPVFNSSTLSYTAEIFDDMAAVDTTATATGSNYRMTIGDAVATSGATISVTPVWDAQGRMELPITVSHDANDAIPATYTLTLVRVASADTPLFDIQPRGASYVDSAAAPSPLTARAHASGLVSYQWYSNTTDSTEGGTLIAGATSATYTPVIGSVDAATTTWYYCVATNASKGTSATSETAAIIVKPDPKPFNLVVTEADGTALSEDGYIYAVGEEATAFKVTAETRGEGGTWSYAWRYRSGSSSGAATAPNNQQTYTPPTTSDMARSYYCRVTYTVDGVSYTTDSPDTPLVSSYFSDVPAPTISVHPVGATYMVKASGLTALSVIASNNGRGTLSYQWEVSTDGGESFAAVEGATARTYAPVAAATAGDVLYRCVVTSTLNSVTGDVYAESVTSQSATLTFFAAGDVGASWDGTGTKDDPYLIEDVDDLVLLRNLVNGDADTKGYTFSGFFFKMTASITLPDGWKPIGTGTTTGNGRNIQPFSGTFDGGGYTITVPNEGLPLLGYVREATVRNLNIYGEKIAGYGLVQNYVVDYGPDGSSGGTDNPAFTIEINGVTLKSGSSTLQSGLIGGYASGVNYVYLKNCVVEQGVIIGYDRDKSAIGSLAGDFNGTVENCVSYADVYGVSSVGGLVGGKGQSMGPCDIWDSAFHGTVTATGNYAGGILGRGYSSSSAPNTPCASIKNCYVTGTITAADRVGGVFGGEPASTQCWANGIGYIMNNVFYGTVVATGVDAQYVGGIIGYMHSLDRYNVIENNYFREGCGAVLGVGGVGAVDTTSAQYGRADDPTGTDADKLAKAASAVAFTDGSVVAALNSGANSSGDWVQGTDGPVFGGSVHPVSLKVRGYYSSYPGGADLNVDSISAVLTYSDGTTLALTGDQLTFSFNSLVAGYQAVVVRYGNMIDIVEVNITSQVALDKAALEARIAEADTLVEAGYTTESWAAFAEALATAKTVAADVTATQSQVDAALSTLNEAITGLVEVTTPSEPEPVLTGIVITAPPTKAEYEVGDTFDPAGLVITASYDDSTSKVITSSEYAISLAASTVLAQAGDITVTVSYTENGVTVTATFMLVVSEAPSPTNPNVADVAAAKAAIESASTLKSVAQSDANNAAAIRAWLERELADIELFNVSYAVSVNVTSAVAGSVSDTDGTNGAYTAAIALAKGAGDARVTDSLSFSGVITATAWTPPAGTIAVTISVESFSFNGDYIVEPTLVTLPTDTLASVALDTLLKDKEIEYRYDNTLTENFYLSGVALAGLDDGYLDASDNGGESGWMLTVNNSFPNVGSAAIKLVNGDVVRWQYTSVGYGADIGGSISGGLSTLPDKDALTEKVARINADGRQGDYGSAYTEALDVLCDLDATLDEINDVLAALLAIDGGTVAPPDDPEPPTIPDGGGGAVSYSEALAAANAWIAANTPSPAVGSVGGEWAVIALARGGQVDRDTDWAKAYLGSLDVALATNKLKSATDYERVVLALSALGIDASSYKGHDLTAPFKDYASVATASNNAKIFGLIALDAKPYTGERDAYIQGILAAQLENGAWSISGAAPNYDITAMAIQALAPYYGSVTGVDVAVDKALAWLDSQPINSAEGAAQVVVALTSLGRDSVTYVNALLSYRDATSGAFTFDGEINAMTSEQAAYALVAYDRYVKQANPLYDMGDIDYLVLEREASAADRDALEEAVDVAIGIDLDLYTEISRAALDKALKDAQTILANPDSTQVEVDTVTLALQRAIDGLVKKPADDGNNGNTTNNNTTNNNTTNNGGNRPVNNYYYYDTSDTETSTSTSSTPTQSQPGASNQNDGRVVDATGGTGATSIEEPPTPQAGLSDGANDSDALLSGGVFISTRALVGIIFGLAAMALLALLIIRLTARRKDVLHD